MTNIYFKIKKNVSGIEMSKLVNATYTSWLTMTLVKNEFA